ncbi:MAG: hypothetical protein II131_04605 [Neisseriaceae bacterium]|nr:hypothetical protein [Neisseriaceae bacterium]
MSFAKVSGCLKNNRPQKNDSRSTVVFYFRQPEKHFALPFLMIGYLKKSYRIFSEIATPDLRQARNDGKAFRQPERL